VGDRKAGARCLAAVLAGRVHIPLHFKEEGLVRNPPSEVTTGIGIIVTSPVA
jgi:hypothetical protein